MLTIYPGCQAHDFFTPQPITSASVFFLKSILHDWPASQIIKILTHLRASATPDTILVVCDILMSYSCREPPSTTTEDYVVLEDPTLAAPDILSTGFNSVNDMVWALDVAVSLNVLLSAVILSLNFCCRCLFSRIPRNTRFHSLNHCLRSLGGESSKL